MPATKSGEKKKKEPSLLKLYIVAGVIVFVLLMMLISGLKSCAAEEQQQPEPTESSFETVTPTGPSASLITKENPLLRLVNKDHPLPDDYQPSLTELKNGEFSVASVVYSDLTEMFAAARAEGLSPMVCSAYRSIELQKQLFDEDVEKLMREEEISYEKAYAQIALYTMPPGCSEHESGLALDIVSVDNQRLDDTQEDTPEQQWLHENCWKYGFILRYPKDKTDITGISYESWHYRYVGREAAKYLTENSLTLEEFWQAP